jgi:hypothetical protein
MYKSPDHTKDAGAWRKFRAPIVRTKYDFRPGIVRRRVLMERFRSRVRRDPSTGCWLWDGAVVDGRPQMYIWDEIKGHNIRQSAFVFLMTNWFPNNRPDRSSNVERICQTECCINPIHHRGRSYSHVIKLTPAQVREIFALRGKLGPKDVAKKYNVLDIQVHNIWSGRAHTDITGQARIKRRASKLTEEQVLQIYQRRGTATQSQLSKEFNVTTGTIAHIWHGRSWTNVTRHSLPG